ncbi:SAM-dependent methyltransferase [Cellulomonas hominis]|uniref:SAM-dependent methyltransferase n=1 Tax=Cellulomonas hominis TaxID=156981 RepID=UPI0014444867|nr:class I SAM-dependent methyltransferase [Cellulomonas hominis]NKY09926.1 class I SAM-dependent methyltransferase [Cellulomonas hominis]
MPERTPLRHRGAVDENGLRVLSDAGLAYADGAEEELARIVAAATDLSSSSEELAAAAHDWGTTYSLVPTRSNIVRALDLTPDMTVLEIGCGCGPITRYLGESCGTVDAVEPMPARARVARLRTRDLDSVQVCVGTLDDVPAEPTYDLVVVVGVLEYIGGGTKDPAPYERFLRQVHAVLKEGGTLALAIENPLGVKYIAGSVEDHTNRPFDSLEGYALASPARTFTRRSLEALLERAGLEPVSTLAAFPDYKLPRALLSDELFRRSDELAAGLPRFPSPDYLVPRMNLADEALTWRTLVDAGVGEHFGNSLFVLSRKAGPGRDLWPQDRLSLLFSTERRVAYAVRGEVVDVAGTLEMHRTPLHPGKGPAAPDDRVRHVPAAREPVVEGEPLLRALVDRPESRGRLLRAWVDMVPDDSAAPPVDLVPHNVMVRADGELVAIDQEWVVPGYPRSAIVLRGLFLAAQGMALLTRPETLAPWSTVRDAVRAMADDAGVLVDEETFEEFVRHEARFQSVVAPGPDSDAARRRAEEDLRAMWDQTLVAVRGGERFDAQWARAREVLAGHADHLAAREEEIQALRSSLAEAQSARDAAGARADAAEQERDRLLRRTLVGLAVRVRRRLRRA